MRRHNNLIRRHNHLKMRHKHLKTWHKNLNRGHKNLISRHKHLKIRQKKPLVRLNKHLKCGHINRIRRHTVHTHLIHRHSHMMYTLCYFEIQNFYVSILYIVRDKRFLTKIMIPMLKVHTNRDLHELFLK
jgi:hypothetical protein